MILSYGQSSLNAENIEMQPGQSKTIGIALMGEVGEALVNIFGGRGN
jgi:hypothetical protein